MRVLDVCCGSKMFWFDKNNKEAFFVDKRQESHILCDGRSLAINPDFVADFTNLPFENESFYIVVFDPPHMESLGKNSWMAKKYGKLNPGWEEELKLGFSECVRVLKKNGTLIFKWSSVQIPVSKILPLCELNPLFGHKSGKQQNTHWITFIK